MPRYAKGTLENAIYADLKREARGLSVRRNSGQSRAHRLESLHKYGTLAPQFNERELDILRELIRNHANLDPNDDPRFLVEREYVSAIEWAQLITKLG